MRRHPEIVNHLGVLVLLGVIMATPFSIYAPFERPTVSQTFFVQLGIIVSGLIYFSLLLISRRCSFRTSGVTLFVILYFLIVLISSVNSKSSLFSLRESIFLFSLILFYLFFQSLVLSHKGLYKFVLAYLLTAVPITLYGIAQAYNFELLPYTKSALVGKKKILSFLGNPNYISFYLAPISFFAFGYGIMRAKRIWRYCWYILGLLIFLCLFLAGTRSAWLGILSGFMIVGFLILKYRLYIRSIRVSLKSIIIAPLVVILGVFFVITAQRLPYNLSERVLSMPEFRHRLFLWQIAREMLIDEPVLGIGYRQFNIKFPDYVIKFFSDDEQNRALTYILKAQRDKRPGHLHNEYIEVLVETGILGFLFFLLVIIGVFTGGIRHLSESCFRRQEKLFITFFLGGFTCLLVVGFWGFPFQLPCSGLLFWFCIAFLEKFRTLTGLKGARDV
ncbi:O-antigen ligase family protein [Candidatus Sumerlaeota bacterium]|nr:O-antigen ligase family protein [Candidatus Sumerlaeota bacterium]